MIEFKIGQLIVMLSPFTEVEIYGNVKSIADESLILNVKTAGLVKEDLDILCFVLDNTDVYEFYSKVEQLEGNDVKIKKPSIEELSSIEKNEFNMVECEIGFVSRLLSINDVSVGKLGKTFLGTIKNMSMGSILAETSLCLPKGTVFSFKLKVNYFIDCMARVREITEIPDEKKYEMDCELMNMSIESIKIISTYIFREQLKRKQKELYKSMFE